MKFYKNLALCALTTIILCTSAYAKKTVATTPVTKYPDYSYEFVGNDKFEGFNRKMFNFN